MTPYGIAWRVGSILIFFIVTAFAFCLAFPFQPYKHLAITDLPETACINGGVTATVERNIETPLLGSLSHAQVKSWWQDTSTGSMESAGDVPIPLEAAGYETITSPVLREAPSQPGTYRLYTETTAFGYIGPVPRHATIATYADDSVEVIEDCKNGEG